MTLDWICTHCLHRFPHQWTLCPNCGWLAIIIYSPEEEPVDIQIGDVLIQRSFQTLWAVVEIEPDLVLRDPYGLQPDLCMPAILATSPDFDMIFKFAWHSEEEM